MVVKLWRQESEKGPFVSATLGRTHRDKETGEYREYRSLSGTDVLKGHALLLEAHREIGKWREYYRETGELAPQPAKNLAAERDAAMAQAKGPVPSKGPAQTPEM